MVYFPYWLARLEFQILVPVGYLFFFIPNLWDQVGIPIWLSYENFPLCLHTVLNLPIPLGKTFIWFPPNSGGFLLGKNSILLGRSQESRIQSWVGWDTPSLVYTYSGAFGLIWQFQDPLCWGFYPRWTLFGALPKIIGGSRFKPQFFANNLGRGKIFFIPPQGFSFGGHFSRVILTGAICGWWFTPLNRPL